MPLTPCLPLPSSSPPLSAGILGPDTYTNLAQCESLDDMKMNLQTNEGYAGFLANEPSPISTMTVSLNP